MWDVCTDIQTMSNYAAKLFPQRNWGKKHGLGSCPMILNLASVKETQTCKESLLEAALWDEKWERDN